MQLAVFVDDQSLTRLQLFYRFEGNIESSLNDRTLRSQNDNFIVGIIESWSNAPRIAHRKHLTATSQSVDDISTVPYLARCLQYVGNIHIIFYIIGDVHSFAAFG